jgi:hypothetical protein
VRVLITITGDRADQLRESEIRKALKEAYFVAAVSREVEQESRSRLGAHSVEAVTPLEALELYLDSKSVPQDRARTLLEYGEKLIQESLAPE